LIKKRYYGQQKKFITPGYDVLSVEENAWIIDTQPFPMDRITIARHRIILSINLANFIVLAKSLSVYVLSFACAKERTKEKHTRQ